MCHSVEGQARRSKNRWPSCVPGQILTSHNLQWAKIYSLPVFQFRSRPGSAGNRGSFVSATVSRNFVYVPSIIVSFPFRLSATSLSPIYQTSRHDYFFPFLSFFFFFLQLYSKTRDGRAEADQRGFDVNRRSPVTMVPLNRIDIVVQRLCPRNWIENLLELIADKGLTIRAPVVDS